MNGLTNYIPEPAWADPLTAWYVWIDDADQRLLARRGRPLRLSGPPPQFSDSEVITVAVAIETCFWGAKMSDTPLSGNICAPCPPS